MVPVRSGAKALYSPSVNLSATEWGQSLVFLLLVPPKISIPVGFTFYQPAPECSAWYKKEKALKKQGVATPQRPPTPPAHPASPTKQQLALRL